jgi:hypothetical protein
MGQQEWRFSRFTDGTKDGWELRPFDETTGTGRKVGLSQDNLANVGIAQNMPLSNTQSGENMLVFNGDTSVAPVAPPVGAVYPTLYAIAGELFVIDGLGNVTQLSSHPAIGAKLMWHASNPTGRYSFDYNIFSGVGQIKDVAAPLRTLLFDIDSGKYDIYAADGSVVESSQSDELAAYGKLHPQLDGYEGERGQAYYEFWAKQIGHDDAVPVALQNQFEMDKPGAGKKYSWDMSGIYQRVASGIMAASVTIAAITWMF